MRIIYFAPGNGGMYYCENCYRDALLPRALNRENHDAFVVPLYLPAQEGDDGQPAPETNPAGNNASRSCPIFLNAIRVYLEGTVPLFRYIPRVLGRIFDLPFFIKLAANRSDTVKAQALGKVTEAVLLGENGPIKQEIEQLTDFLGQTRQQVDVFHFSTPLLLGIWPALQRLYPEAICICCVQDELAWIDKMEAKWKQRVFDLMKQHLRQTHAIVSFSHAYMHRFLQQVDYPADQAYIIPYPLDIDAYPARKSEPETPTLGFLSRLCPANGFDLLVEAFLRLHEDPRFRDVRLLATGGIMKEDQPFIERLRQRIGEHQLLSMFEIIPDFRLRDRIHFLSAISILCVPVREPITFGSFMLEANAMGVPVLQPNLPPFVEYIEATKGGELFPANDVEALTEKLRELLLDSPRRKALGAHSQEYVRSHFSLQAAGAALVDVYHQVMTQAGY